MFKSDWDELVSQVEIHGPERVIFKLEEDDMISYVVTDVSWDISEEMVVVRLDAE